MFTIKCPEAGENAILDFDIDALEKLNDAFGDDYIQKIVNDLDARRVSTLKTVLQAALHGGDATQLVSRVDLGTISTRLVNALWLRIHGKILIKTE